MVFPIQDKKPNSLHELRTEEYIEYMKKLSFLLPSALCLPAVGAKRLLKVAALRLLPYFQNS
jgi:hypothetical protein